MKKQNPSSSATDRKLDHIELAFEADMENGTADRRFFYEPMLAGHPAEEMDLGVTFLEKKLKAPLWVSSMTGGTEKALEINTRLATSCARFGLGMGLGSCRPLLDSPDRLDDFNLRHIIGPDLPLYANLGIAQVEELILQGRTSEITALIHLLSADGLIVHINPLQEWLQPEGDFLASPPVQTLEKLLSAVEFPIIVKEVGQGMGPESIRAILTMPVAAFEFAAHGGTNFARLELLRSTSQQRDVFDIVSRIGHPVSEMISFINDLFDDPPAELLCRQFIISGGVRDFLDGYYWMKKLRVPAIYGQASGFLRHAAEGQEALDEYLISQIQGLKLANTFLKVR